MLENLKQEMVETGVSMLSKGLVILADGGMCARDPETKLVLVKPAGIEFRLIRPEDIIVTDCDGNVIEGALRPSSELKTWLRIFSKCPDIHGIVHTHSPFATSYAVVRKPVLPLNLISASVGGQINCCDEAREGSVEMGDNIVEALEGWKKACLLPGHGVMVVGGSLKEALRTAEILEEGAKLCTYAHLIGEAQPVNEEISKSVTAFFPSYYQR